MSKFAGVLCLLLAACVTGGAGLDRETAPRAAARFKAISVAATSPEFPVARNPQLPSADRISRVILSVVGESASADIRLCIAPDGHVRGLQLVRGSSLPAFDAALLHDVADWQFAEAPGSSFASTLRTCEVATVTYRPHQ